MSTPLFNLSDTQCLLPSVCQTPFTRAVFTGSLSAPGIPEAFGGREGGRAVGEEGFASLSIVIFSSSRTSETDKSEGFQEGGASQGFNTVIAGPGKGEGKLLCNVRGDPSDCIACGRKLSPESLTLEPTSLKCCFFPTAGLELRS